MLEEAALGCRRQNEPCKIVCRDEALPRTSPHSSPPSTQAGIEMIPSFQVPSFDARAASKGTLNNPALQRQRRGGKRVSGIKTL